MSAAEYIAKLAERAPIIEVRREIELVAANSPSVQRQGYDRFIGEIWQRISKYYI